VNLKCIYCQEIKPISGFSKAEHVLSQSFGKYENNLTLNSLVCDQCNQFFGDNLEIDLARDTFEGLSRFDHGVKEPSEFKSMGKRSRLTLKVSEGHFEGAFVYLQYSPDINDIIIRPIQQIGFRHPESGKFTYYPIADIPTKSELDAERYQLDDVNSVIALGLDASEADKILTSNGIQLTWGDAQGLPPEPGAWDVQVEGVVDVTLVRALAKISFNFLAYHEGDEFVTQADFDPIRRFIRYGEIPEFYPVSVRERPILGDELASQVRRLAHLVTINWSDNRQSIVSMISLFNIATYSIALARDYQGSAASLGYGSLFDPINNLIHQIAPEAGDGSDVA
jgi:hypothetical protein